MSIDDIFRKPFAFAGVFLVAFFLSAVFLNLVDFVPESVATGSTEDAELMQKNAESDTVAAPSRIVIPAIGVDVAIENPTSTDIAILDAALLSGVVRYPGSALLGEDATMFLFGHQSYLPVVRNQAFKAFNGLQNLEEGDTITVSSATADYAYRVSSVTLTTAAEGVIELETGARKLVLSTCNSFGKKSEERFVVKADLISRTQHI
ncbi:MAG TPA: sortase [Burkholderiales bacterium]|nr:sortase [Burkholderiales bacterium]